MSPFGHVLVGIDLSPTDDLASGSRELMALAAQLARTGGARVTLLHATREDAYLARQGSARLLVTREGLSARGKARLERAAAELREDGATVTLALPDARAGAAIIGHAREHGVDLVVVATRSHSDFENDFDARRLGTVALELMRRCPAAVWAVRPGQSPVPRRILGATDLGPEMGRAIVQRAAQLASQLGAELHLVHAPQLKWNRLLSSDDAARTAELERLGAEAERWMSREVAAITPELVPRCHTPHAAAYLAVADVAARVEAELVVMGTVARSGLSEKLVGNTAERMLGTLDRSLLVLKPER